MADNSSLKRALFIVRISLVLFFAVWAGEKFIDPASTLSIWEAFYHLDALPVSAAYAVGVVQTIAVILFALGMFKFWSYGFFMIIHGLTVLATYNELLNPYAGGNHLFAAAVPALGALIALFLLRDEDTMLTVR